MITGGAASVAMTIIKLATALGVTTAVITGVKWFNTFELKEKKASKGGSKYGGDIDPLYEKIKGKY